MTKHVGQFHLLLVCKHAGVGMAVVLEYGAGGRAHKECLQDSQKPVITSNSAVRQGMEPAEAFDWLANRWRIRRHGARPLIRGC
jgi:hypothetical protein